jgi:septal ring-binding cell division protein DamX
MGGMFNDHGGSRTDTLIKLVLVFFLSLLSFSVGTFVGKQFSDSQHKIAELENSSAEGDRSTASIPPTATKPEVGKAIGDDEISKLSDEFIKKERDSESGADSLAAKNDVATAGLPGSLVADEKKAISVKKPDVKKMNVVKDEIAEVSKRIAKGQAEVVSTAHKNRIPSSLPKEVAGSSIGKYTVQVSSYPSEKEAVDHAQELKDKGLSAFSVKADVNGKTWYRVCLGKFDNRKAALEYRTKVMQEAELKSAIVQKIVPEVKVSNDERKTASEKN